MLAGSQKHWRQSGVNVVMLNHQVAGHRDPRTTKQLQPIINPRRADAQRGLRYTYSRSVCLSACLSVCLRLFLDYRLRGGL